MMFPGLNAFFYPFLCVMQENTLYERDEIAERIIEFLNLTPEHLQMRTRNNVPLLVHRMAFCAGLLARAGFVNSVKRENGLNSLYQITPLGLKQRHRKGSDLTLSYLQTFYKGRIYRGTGSDDTTSSAEIELMEQLEKLPDTYTVYHSTNWIAHSSRKGSVGEADFIVAHPQYGIVVIEVKGGRISLSRKGGRTQWYSQDYADKLHEINDPIAQVIRNGENLRAWLENDKRTRHFKYSIFHAVAFPDTTVEADLRMDCPKAIIIDARDMNDIETAIKRIFDYWLEHSTERNKNMGGNEAVKALTELLVPSKGLTNSVATIFERERKKIEALTRRQFHVLSMLNRHRRAAIVGGAGTGKTMLAMEKAKQLSLSGFRVLFLAYNRYITEWIANNLNDDRITVSTFHSFVNCAREEAGFEYQGSGDEFFRQAADLLDQALIILRQQRQEWLFDAIIVDEAQDFEDIWWLVLPNALKAQETGVFYVFFDDNQQLYNQVSNVPIIGEPLYLVENCRNTQSIHCAIQRYALTHEESYCEGPEGRPVQHIPASTMQEQRKELQKLLHQLVNEARVLPKEIVVLTPASQDRSELNEGTKLGNFILTWNLGTDTDHDICVSTIYRYKGLEASVVILMEMDKASAEKAGTLVYVGLSRARHDAYVIGALPKPK